MLLLHFQILLLEKVNVSLFMEATNWKKKFLRLKAPSKYPQFSVQSNYVNLDKSLVTDDLQSVLLVDKTCTTASRLKI